MKHILVLSILFIAVSCSSTRNTSTERDGSSIEKAIIVKSVSEEYQWIRDNYPNSRPMGQSLIFNKKKPYDVIHIQTEAGSEKDIYFDISKFYGRF